MANNVQDLISSLPDDKIGKKFGRFYLNDSVILKQIVFYRQNCEILCFPKQFPVSLWINRENSR